MIISNNYGIHELPHQLPNDLRLMILRKLGNIRKISKIPQNYSLVLSRPPKMVFVFNTRKKTSEKQIIEYFPQYPISHENYNLLRYFVHDCIWERLFIFYTHQTPLNLIWLTILVALMVLTRSGSKLRATNLPKRAKNCLI